jgi:hypothetical protein
MTLTGQPVSPSPAGLTNKDITAFKIGEHTVRAEIEVPRVPLDNAKKREELLKNTKLAILRIATANDLIQNHWDQLIKYLDANEKKPAYKSGETGPRTKAMWDPKIKVLRDYLVDNHEYVKQVFQSTTNTLLSNGPGSLIEMNITGTSGGDRRAGVPVGEKWGVYLGRFSDIIDFWNEYFEQDDNERIRIVGHELGRRFGRQIKTGTRTEDGKPEQWDVEMWDEIFMKLYENKEEILSTK